MVPSDSHKKNLANCSIAMQHLKQAGVPLFDEDGSVIIGEDIVSGDKELTLSLLWNIFIHLQVYSYSCPTSYFKVPQIMLQFLSNEPSM